MNRIILLIAILFPTSSQAQSGIAFGDQAWFTDHLIFTQVLCDLYGEEKVAQWMDEKREIVLKCNLDSTGHIKRKTHPKIYDNGYFTKAEKRRIIKHIKKNNIKFFIPIRGKRRDIYSGQGSHSSDVLSLLEYGSVLTYIPLEMIRQGIANLRWASGQKLTTIECLRTLFRTQTYRFYVPEEKKCSRAILGLNINY